MSVQALQISVTNLLHSNLDHLKDPWRPEWVLIHTDYEVAGKIKAAHSTLSIAGLAGVVAPLTGEDFDFAFSSASGDLLRIKAQFVTVIVTRDGMRIELFDPRMELEAETDTQETSAYILIHCSLMGLI